jgi:hypothetical protein
MTIKTCLEATCLAGALFSLVLVFEVISAGVL